MPNIPDIHFEVSERKVLLRILDIVFALFFLHSVGTFFNFDYFKITEEHWVWIFVLTLYLSLFGTIFELYDLKQASKFQTVLKNSLLTVSITVLFYLLTPFFTPVLPENRLQIIFFFVAIAAGILFWRWLYITLISSPRFYKKVLLIGDADEVVKMATTLEGSDPNYKIIGYVDAELRKGEVRPAIELSNYPVKNLLKTVRKEGVSEVVVANDYKEGVSVALYNELLELLESGFPIREYVQVYEEINQRIPVTYVDRDFYKYFPFSRSNQNKLYLFFHRLADLFFSVIGLLFLILLVPFMLLGNLIANRGPLLYTQKRVGKNGKKFKIVKLRTMVKDAERNGAVWAQKNDLRVTPFGRFLRNSRLDEIPQFFNVLIGEMSLIGPRPERPVFVKELSKQIPFYETRHIVKPGLTGWAQVMSAYGDDEAAALKKLQYDLYYIKRRSIFMDLSILLKTMSTVIFYRGQ